MRHFKFQFQELFTIKPPKLQPGDTIGIVSPSWGGAGIFPHRVELGTNYLRSLGFKVKIGQHALNHQGYVSDTAANRVQDIHDMFADPEIKAIIATVGGDHSCHLLPHLDFSLIRDNPKIFMGYSDITVLNIAIWKMTGLVTLNGPALLTDFAEFPRMLDYTETSFLQTLGQPQAVGPINPSPWWTEEILDWRQKKDLERPRKLSPSPGWSWLKPGQARGNLVGGCLESLEHLRGTPYWPDWDEAIFFFETSEEKPSPAEVDGILMDYENMGVLEKLTGLIAGRPMAYSEEEKEKLREVILARTEAYSFPIISDMDFGHTAPQFILPIGCQAYIDSGQKRFEISETAVN